MRPEDYEIVEDSDLITLECKIDDIHSGLRNIYKRMNPYPSTIILHSRKKSGIDPITVSNSYGSSIIIQPKHFRPDTRESYYLTAHELGHSYHSFFKSDVVGTTLIIIIYLTIIIVLGLKLGEPNCMYCGIICSIVALISIWLGFEAKAESFADIIALQMIQDQKGVDTMHDAADYLIIERISAYNNCSFRNELASKFSFYNSILLLTYFISEHNKTELVNWQEINLFLRRYISKYGATSDNAKRIQIGEQSSFHIISLAVLIFETYSLVFKSRFLISTSLFSGLNWLVVIAGIIILLVFFKIIFNLLCKAHSYQLRRIGIS